MADLSTAEAALRAIGVFALGSAKSKSVGDQLLLDQHCRFGRSIASLEVFTEQAHNSVRACTPSGQSTAVGTNTGHLETL